MIAQAVGISRATVSYVLNGQARERKISSETIAQVEQAAQRMNYRPNLAAQQLRGVRSGLIGVLMPHDATLLTRYRVTRMERQAMRLGRGVIIGQVTPEALLKSRYLDDFESRQVEGIVCIGGERCRAEDLDLLAHRRFEHTVFFDCLPRDERMCSVSNDHAPAARAAVRHLVQRGRRRIALAIGDLKWLCNETRHRGYREQVAAEGLGVDESLVHIRPHRPGTDPFAFSNEYADELVRRLVLGQGADAIIADTDWWAAMLIKQLRRHGYHVPRDIAIVGQDNSDIATAVDPALTTIDQNDDRLAEVTIDLLIRLLEEGLPPVVERRITVDAELVVREST